MLRADAETDFLAFSLPDALTASLSGLDTLVMRSSLVAGRFAGAAPDVQRIAREAQVDLVVSGTLMRVGNQLHVAAQLADAAAGTLIWSHTEQTSIVDLFRLQDALVDRITASLSRPLTESASTRMGTPTRPCRAQRTRSRGPSRSTRISRWRTTSMPTSRPTAVERRTRWFAC